MNLINVLIRMAIFIVVWIGVGLTLTHYEAVSWFFMAAGYFLYMFDDKLRETIK